MSSLTRMLTVLDLFTLEEPSLTAEGIMDRLQFSKGTGYRYIKELTQAGFLARNAGRYSLGPRIIELDYLIRATDPLIQAIQPLARSMSNDLECDVLWATLVGSRVVVAHHEKGPTRLSVSYGRGQRLPLFLGAGSKVIVASLPLASMKRLYSKNTVEIHAAGLGISWSAFKSTMDEIRRTGHFISRGELDQGNVGVAAPILHSTTGPSSLVLVFSEKRYAYLDEGKILQVLKENTDRVSNSSDRNAAAIDSQHARSSGH